MMELLASIPETNMIRAHIAKIQSWGCEVRVVSLLNILPSVQLRITAPNSVVVEVYASTKNSGYRYIGCPYCQVTSTPLGVSIDASVPGIPFLTEIVRKVLSECGELPRLPRPSNFCCFVARPAR